MAYFIVIGTDNDVKDVVDEVKRSHLQHNVVTSGCLITGDDGLYYHWDVFNGNGEKTQEDSDSKPIVLREALTNQISQFKAFMPAGAIPNIFVISRCLDEKGCQNLRTVCEELYQVGGSMLANLLVDIVIIGYDLNRPENVTMRPHWKLLESLKGLADNSNFHTQVLYVNNMDYMGAATNIDSRILGRLLCHWSKMVCSAGCDPKATVHSKVYSIGLSEHQYDFQDLNDFFKLAAEERLLDRTLNNQPSTDTQKLIDTNYFKEIDLNAPWIDGLRQIQSIWKDYCLAQWNPSLPLENNPYSVSKQEQVIAAFLNAFLKLYIAEEQREIKKLETEKAGLSHNKGGVEPASSREEQNEDLSDASIKNKGSQTCPTENQVCDRVKEIDSEIERHQQNIKNNTFIDADAFGKEYGTKELITKEDKEEYEQKKANVTALVDYVKSQDGIHIMREAIKGAYNIDIQQDRFRYPACEIANMGRAEPIGHTSFIITLPALHALPVAGNNDAENLSQHPGCLFWFKSLFNKKDDKDEENSDDALHPDNGQAPIGNDTIGILNKMLNKSVDALNKADELRDWWSRLCRMTSEKKQRQTECNQLMNGEKDINGNYLSGKEGYCPKSHTKLTSLIDMDRVRSFRDSDGYYKQNIDSFLNRWFDKSIDPNDRMTMPELIKHQVLDPLVGRYHTLRWDGRNPFVNDLMPDAELQRIIQADIEQSKPFVEYVRIHETNIVANLNINFFSNNPNIPKDPVLFRNQYQLKSNSITPVFQEDFVNALCVVQIMDVPDHIDAIKDFKPKRETELSAFSIDIRNTTADVIREASTHLEKIRAIYNWICDNISYDTTQQIHDAETCYKTGRGVCQAYCELFCQMAESVGLTADIIVGKTKNKQGIILEDKHSWIFAYTHGYDGIFIDPTWGAGAVDGAKFVKGGDNSTWFDVSPYWMIFSHLPDQPHWAKIDSEITWNQFQKLPYKEKRSDSDGKNAFFECLSII